MPLPVSVALLKLRESLQCQLVICKKLDKIPACYSYYGPHVVPVYYKTWLVSFRLEEVENEAEVHERLCLVMFSLPRSCKLAAVCVHPYNFLKNSLGLFSS